MDRDVLRLFVQDRISVETAFENIHSREILTRLQALAREKKTPTAPEKAPQKNQKQRKYLDENDLLA